LSIFSECTNLKKLIIYKKALALLIRIYQLIRNNVSLSRDFSLCDQLKRAAISVLTNIAEGYYRSQKQSQNYLQISSGSANEVVALLDIVSAVYKVNTTNIQEEYVTLGRQINAFSRSLTDN